MKKFLPKLKNNPQGFTLIELMVVVSIIAFLSVIGVVSFTNVQAQSRDGRRRADIDAIATALEANRDPVGGTYLAVNDTNKGTLFADGNIPTDPINALYNTATYGYTANASIVAADYKSFVVCALLEKANGNYSDAGTTTATGSTATYYCRKNQQ